MIHATTPNGKHELVLRGVVSPRGVKDIVRGSVLTPDGDKVFWGGITGDLSVTRDRSTVSGAASSDVSVEIATSLVSVTAAGGTPPYSYAWSTTDNDGGNWTIASPGKAETLFRHASVDPAEVEQTTFTCKVTDGAGRTGQVGVNAFVRNYGGFGDSSFA